MSFFSHSLDGVDTGMEFIGHNFDGSSRKIGNRSFECDGGGSGNPTPDEGRTSTKFTCVASVAVASVVKISGSVNVFLIIRSMFQEVLAFGRTSIEYTQPKAKEQQLKRRKQRSENSRTLIHDIVSIDNSFAFSRSLATHLKDLSLHQRTMHQELWIFV